MARYANSVAISDKSGSYHASCVSIAAVGILAGALIKTIP
jgi:hypothetical protein